jgi:hypothetical protein
MEISGIQENILESEAKYFENYEVKSRDLEVLQQGIDTVANSQLLEEEVLDNIRFVTYDSKSLYVFTRGEHATNESFTVEEMPSTSKTGFRIFKTSHSGFIGRDKEDYRGARAWLLCNEIETTAVNARKFPNPNILYQPELPQPTEILDVVSMAPEEPYNKIQKGAFNYLTDVVFHEAGHIEHRRLENWQEGEGIIETFPSKEQKKEFFSVVEQTRVFPQWIVSQIIENTTKGAINELYPMVIDQEAAKRYDTKKFNDENAAFQSMLTDLQDESTNPEYAEWFKNSLGWNHTTGRLLVRVLEDYFPDFGERKRFVRPVLERKTIRKQNVNSSRLY